MGIGGGHDEREQTLNEMLVQMDGFAPSSGVVVIAATNRPDILDPALLRPGRFDRHVVVEPPDVEGRFAILQLHAAKRPMGRIAAGVDLGAIARLTPGFSGADLANLINEASLLAIRRRSELIEQVDLMEAIDRVLTGPKRTGRLLSPKELSRLAHHEAGHVVVAAASAFPSPVRRVSIVSRGRNAAHTDLTRTDRTVLSRSELNDQLAVIMAGTVAEELVTNEPSTASEADLERATELARDMVGRFGMSATVGRMRILGASAEVFLGRDYMTSQYHSGDTLSGMDAAVAELISAAEVRAREILVARPERLDAVAAALLEKETLEEFDLAPLLVDTGTRRGRSRR